MLLLPLASAWYTAGAVATQGGDTCGGGLAAFQPASPKYLTAILQETKKYKFNQCIWG